MSATDPLPDPLPDPLRGTACYTADIPPAGALHAAFLRSDRAHAELRGVATEDALAVPGVVAVLTAADLGPLGAFPAFLRQPTVDGRPLVVPHRPVLAQDRVRHVGEPVALVLAHSHAAALDGVEALVPGYADLPAVVGLNGAPDGPAIHEAAPGNLAAAVSLGDPARVQAAMAAAARIIQTSVTLPRLAPAPMEPLAALAAYDPDTGRFDLWTPHQGIAEQRRDICAVLGVAPEAVRLHAERVGGAFGVRGAAFPETVALLAAARKLGQRIRWQSTRSEAFQTDYHGRGMRLTGRLALDADNRFTALDVTLDADLGAYVHPVGAHISVNNPSASLTGCYGIPAAHGSFRLWFTNAVPVGPYRGAGRPEMALLVERLVDEAAAATGTDPLALRRTNALPPAAFPHATPLGWRYDSGDYPGLIDRARAAADWSGFPARAAADRARGQLRGIGAALFVEVAGGGATARDDARLKVRPGPDGATVAIETPAQSTGQDHAGLFTGLVADRLGLPSGRLSLAQSPADTPAGAGSFASRTTVQLGSALHDATGALIARLLAAEAARLGQPPEALRADAQAIRDDAGRILCTLSEALDRAAAAGPFAVTGTAAVVTTFPSGCHVAEVAIDPDTGALRLHRYVAVDDSGRVLSRHGVEGQLRGGIAQGFGGAVLESHAFDPTGQLMTASLMDYALPRASDLPALSVLAHDTPSPTNPLGAKGAGEAGTTGALAAMVNAVAAALRAAGAPLPPLPLCPVALWQALQPRP